MSSFDYADLTWQWADRPEGSLQMTATLPAEGTEITGAILFFFGGGWKHGSISQFFPHARHLSERGLVALCAEYRVAGRHGTDPYTAVEDACAAYEAAVAWLREKGYPLRVILAGGSAGGHLALMVAHSRPAVKPVAVLGFNPVIDTSAEGYGFDRLGEQWSTLSPRHLPQQADDPPIWLTYGENDSTTPLVGAQAYVEQAQAVGRPVELVTFPGKGHGFFNWRPNSRSYFVRTMAAADAFLVTHGILPR